MGFCPESFKKVLFVTVLILHQTWWLHVAATSCFLGLEWWFSSCPYSSLWSPSLAYWKHYSASERIPWMLSIYTGLEVWKSFRFVWQLRCDIVKICSTNMRLGIRLCASVQSSSLWDNFPQQHPEVVVAVALCSCGHRLSLFALSLHPSLGWKCRCSLSLSTFNFFIEITPATLLIPVQNTSSSRWFHFC